MKLDRGGQIADLREYTGYSKVHIHRILNGERSAESRSGIIIFKALEIMKQGRKDTKEKIKEYIESIEKKGL